MIFIEKLFHLKSSAKSFKISLILILCCFSCSIYGAERRGQRRQRSENNVVAEMQVICRSDSIMLKVDTNSPFNGMIYAKDAPSGGNNCMSEYSSSTNMTFRLPLKSCGTLFSETDDGIEYFNTIIVQPHMRLMTNQGKGYHIRCKYQTRERTISNTHFNVSASFPMQNGPQSTGTTPLMATASMPSCTMKIFRSGRDDVAEAVKIGDKLIMVIEIDQQDMYGMKITNCVVRDGLNVAEQQLINDGGCPIDENIMPKFEYTNNFTRAAVSFPAHKFPHTSSVYYQCNVRLCINNNGGCNPADCNLAAGAGAGNGSGSGSGGSGSGGNGATTGTSSSSSNSLDAPRRKRMVDHESNGSAAAREQPSAEALNLKSNGPNMSFDVYSGLYVSDLDVGESGSSDVNAKASPPRSTASASASASATTTTTTTATKDEDNNQQMICMTPGQMSPLILIGSLGVVAALFMLLCQLGVLGRDQQQVVACSLSEGLESNKNRSLVNSSFVVSNNRLQQQQQQQQQRRRNSSQYNPNAVADCRQPYQCYTEPLA